ncbi:MAG: MBL fold metallo-hydrolase [Pseudomonadota bacterium]
MSNLFVKQIAIGPMMNFAYLVGANQSQEAIAIDVAWDAQKIIDEAKKAGRQIAAILLTHTHYDHCNAVDDFTRQQQVPIYVHKSETSGLSQNLKLKPTQEGLKLEIAGLQIECLHSPGHTPGSQCFLIDDALFTGDTLFVGNCGRVDLPGSSPKDMENSLLRLSKLPETVVVYPGHDYGDSRTSTIGEEKRSNYYMKHGV